MKRSAADARPDPGFEVEISRGGRAAAELSPARIATPVNVGPPHLAARSRRGLQQRVLAGVLAVAVVFVAVVFAVAWWSAQPPAGVLARVNGEEITVAQVDKKILISRAITALLNGKEETPSRGAILDSLIQERMQAQDAARAGVSVSDDEIAQFVQSRVEANGKSVSDLDTALKGYGLTRADFYADQKPFLLINKYVGEKVVAGATSDNERQQKQNDWLAALQNTSKVERFGTPDEPTAPRIGATAPNFTLRDLSGKIVSLSDFHGRPVLINFWATWCDPCRRELPTIQAAYAQRQASGPQAAQGLAILGVAVESDPAIVTSFQKEFGLAYSILPDEADQIKNLYRVGPIPTSFFIDRQGTIRAIKVEAMEAPELGKDLDMIK
ncbi:MAG: redoxin domain-containing protein [Chloroflexia bacterium]